MNDNSLTETIEKSVNLWFRGLIWVVMSIIFLYAGGVLCIVGAYFGQFGITSKSIKVISDFLIGLRENPASLGDAYIKWWEIFILAYKYGQLLWSSFIPFIAPVMFLILTIGAYVKSPCSFKLWYRLNNRYARLDDVEKMGLLNGSLMALGKFQDYILQINRSLSVFGWGSPGLGKTSTVAIPSVLESDNASVVAVDCKGALVKYTSGYRESIGKVFNFNWNMQDRPEQGEFWPRWNPFSECNLPPKGLARDRYLATISKYILSEQGDSYWGKLASIALEGLLQFYVSKIEQAYANDYFLSEILDNGKLSNEDKDVLLSYYALMPEEYSKSAIENLENNTLTLDNYLPIGSWQNIPALWQGKEFCFAMLVDCLIERFYSMRQEDESKEFGRWKAMLSIFIKESEFLGYHPRANQVMQHLFYLTKKQRKMIFAMMLEPLSVFRKDSIRERTSSSDFSMSEARGERNQKTREWQVATIYVTADNRSAAFMTRFFVDMLIKTNMEEFHHKSPYPLLFVLDDFEGLPKFSLLNEGLARGFEVRMSFLLLTDNLKNIHDNYGANGLEDIICNSSYKLMFADNNKNLSDNFNHLAIYGTKSVQIPQTDTGAFFKVKLGLADASYYQRIAKGLLDTRKAGVVKKGQHLLLVQGYYHLPVRINSLFFLREDDLKNKAMMPAAYFLDAEKQRVRDVQDSKVPLLISVLQEAGVQVEREEEIDDYLNDQIEVVAEKVKQAPQDKQTALAEDISARWTKESTPEKAEKTKKGEDWWMSEDSFSLANDVDENPFEKH